MTVSETWRDLVWPISLEQPPVVVQAGIGIHGLHGPEQYRLRDLWSLHLYFYETNLQIGDQRVPIRPGYAGVIPPNVPTAYAFRERVQHLFVHFRCPETAQEARPQQIPALQDLGDAFPRVAEDLQEALEEPGAPSAHRLQARVWDLLWRLTERPQPAAAVPGARHPAVALAVRLIERRLAEPISIARLAEECGVSESYLGRLFRQALGMTVVGYVRARRVERAAHLLRHSTLPIKTIAAACGLPDLHFFNKTLRQALGRSPRALREDEVTD